MGRVCFHLAENKRDPDFPFAFLATYAPSLSKGGRVQYQPLSKALQEYAGERNKKALIKLLSPVHRASEKVAFVKELVDSGDVFHPLAWTPGEAYRFLKNVPLLEESGLLVRLPDWWKKRPRPRVGVTIGEKRQSSFDADAMLDFKVGLALGDQKLTEAEWRQIMASEDGLVYVKGQWVEVDREKLPEALDHWKRLENEAGEGGLSFIEGMRLLAGAPADLRPTARPKTRSGSGRSSTRANGSARCSRACAIRTIGFSARARRRTRFEFCGTLRPYQETGSTGSGSCHAWGWAPAWPTTWAWARRSRCWRCCRR